MSANANIEMVRLKFCSYNYEPLIAAISEMRKILEKFPDVKFTTIPLPNKQKYYCVNRSPHVNTNSREQFGIEELSQIVIANAKPGDVVICLGAGSISSWASALPKLLHGGF